MTNLLVFVIILFNEIASYRLSFNYNNMNKKFLLVLAGGLIFATSAFAASDLGSLRESIVVGKVLSVGLNPSSSGNWYLGANSNSAVATASISSNSLLINGKSVGSATISACTDAQGNHCLEVNVNVIPTGSVLGVNTENAHPLNSWVIQGQTVFYVDANGLIPITTWKIFLSNGGKQSLIQPINFGDLKLPLEAFMLPHDSRVQN